MNNKKLIYILFTIITLFSFNMNVKAAQELTCVYEAYYHYDHYDKIAFIQYSDGTKEIYLNNNNGATVNDGGWSLIDAKIKISDVEKEKKDSSKNLTACPSYSHLNFNHNTVTFMSESAAATTSKEPVILETPYTEIKKITGVTTTPPEVEDITKGVRCDNVEKMQVSEFDANNYTASCVYARDVEEGCHIVQIDLNKNGNISVSQVEPNSKNLRLFTIDGVTLNTKTISKEFDGFCPNRIYVKRALDLVSTTKFNTNVSLEFLASDYVMYEKKVGKGKNITDSSKEQTNELMDFGMSSMIGTLKETFECSDLFGDENGKKIQKILSNAVILLKVAIPILLIGLGIMDFAKAVFSGKEDDMKKSQGKFMKRVAIGICIFLIPSLLKLVLTIASGVWGNISPDFCGIL